MTNNYILGGTILGKKVLYSTVGGTDPIANFRDGSMLHICRIYKPDEVYLMMSQEISNHHRHDDRYRYCLNKLSEMINHKFNIHVIEYRDLTDVNMFDPVYECIAKDIESIRNNLNEDDILYVNVSSGTPAMKYCLQIISAVSDFNIIPIIVSTPTKKMNKHEEDKENYDFKDYWELNEDNDENEFENRAKETTSSVFYALLNKITIKKFILNYNYSAALEIIGILKTNLYNNAIPLIEAAQARVQRNIKKSYKTLTDAGFRYPFELTDKRFKVFEYALEIGIKLKHHEYNDFVRSLTPLMTDLYIRTLEKKCSIKLEDYIVSNNKNTTKMVWDDTKICGTDMQEALNNKYGKFRGGIVYNTHLVAIIKDYIYKNHMEKEKFSECISMLSNVEEELRNIAAHTMVAFDKEKIKKITGNYPEEIYNTIMNLMADLNIPVIKRNSYDEMNLILIDAIDKYNENINT